MHYAYVGTPNNRDHASNPFWGLDSQLSPGDGPREAVRMLDLVESTLDRRAICIGLNRGPPGELPANVCFFCPKCRVQ